jgi:hypothetical protein
MADPFVAQLGRISGPLLSENLVRYGVDLTFRNRALDPDLLFLEVNNLKIGVNKDSPVFTLDVETGIHTEDIIVSNRASIANIVFQTASTVTTSVGPINIRPATPNPISIFDKFGTIDSQLNPLIYLDGNTIQSYNNTNILFDPNQSGTIELNANVEIVENNPLQPALSVNGNIDISGNLSSNSNVFIGDSPLDVVIFRTDLTQDLNPGTDLAFNIGAINKRWSEAYIDNWRHIGTIRPSLARIADTMLLDGVSNQIVPLTANTDIKITPDSGVTVIEQLRFENNTITNLNNTTPITLFSTGNGYYRFTGSNGLVIPAGTVNQRPLSPQVGDTRWNTELGYLECFDGTVYITSIGPGDPVSQTDMEELSNVYTLVFG